MTIANTPSFTISGNGLSNPFDIAFDASGDFWVSNYANSTLQKFSGNGTLIQTIATGLGLTGLALNQSGNLWVTSFVSQSVQEISTDTGVVIQTLPGGEEPVGLAIDADGNVWLSNISGNGMISKYSGSGGFEPVFSTGHSFSYDLEFDASGHLWLTDFNGNSVKEFSADGVLMRTFSEGLAGPVGITFDASGDLWVANYESGTIQEISPDGALMQTLSTGMWGGVTGLAFDSAGNLWVTGFEADTVLGFLNIVESNNPTNLNINGYLLPYEIMTNGSLIEAGKNTLKIAGSSVDCYGGGLDYSTSLQDTGNICTGFLNAQSNSKPLYSNYITNFIAAATLDYGGFSGGYNCAYLSDFQGRSNYSVSSIDNSKHTTINCLDLVNDAPQTVQKINLSGYDGIVIINNGIDAVSNNDTNVIGMLGGSCNFAVGDHKVYVMAPNCTVNGGEGMTTADMFTVSKEQASITKTGDNLTIWAGWANTGSGVTNLFNVDRVEFADGAIAYDTGLGQSAGEAYRIYKAVFDRVPDASGLGFWIKAIDDGASLASVAGGFISSNEFQKLYGADVSDRDYVSKLYNNVLDRNPDQTGYDFWLGALRNGASREDILVSFSESKENIANTAELIANGIQYEEWVT